MAAGYQLTAGQMKAIRETVRTVMMQHRGELRPTVPVIQQRNLTGFTIGDITAATSAIDGHTTFDFGVLSYNTGTSEYEDSGIRLEGINVDASLVAVHGTLIRCEWVDGKWQVYWCACDADPDLEALEAAP